MTKNGAFRAFWHSTVDVLGYLFGFLDLNLKTKKYKNHKNQKKQISNLKKPLVFPPVGQTVKSQDTGLVFQKMCHICSICD